MNFFKKIFLEINTRSIYIFSIGIGLISGVAAILFYECIYLFQYYAFDVFSHMPLLEPGSRVISPDMISSAPNRVIFFILPIIGGLLTGLVIHFFGSEAAGGGTDVVLDAFHNRDGILRKRTSLIKFLSSAFTLGTGGSGGKEGPMTLIGAGIGSSFGSFIKMGARAQRTLMLAGVAGGLGAVFRTPLGGAITAVEVLYKEDFESDALIPCIISSVTAYTVFGSVMGFGHTLNFHTEMFHTPLELFFYAILALVCTFSAFIFIKLHHAIGENFFNKIPVPKILLPALGGLMLGCMGLMVPEVMGGGLGVVQQAIYGTYSAQWEMACVFFLLLAALKMFATSFTVQSGGSAGTLVPCFFIGAMLGGFCGTFFHHFFPDIVTSPIPFIVVGMAAFFSAATNASLGALVMVTELTGGYELLPPLMLVAVISLILSHKWSLYKNQVPNKFASKAHVWDMKHSRPRIDSESPTE